MEIKFGTVESNEDISQTGMFNVRTETGGTEFVQYVSPYGNGQAAFVAIPTPGSEIMYVTRATDYDGAGQGNYYLGCIMGALPDMNRVDPAMGTPFLNDDPTESNFQPPITGVPGLSTPPEVPKLLARPNQPIQAFPARFKDLYTGRGVIPEMLGLTSHYGDALLVSNRYRSGAGNDPFQDHMVELRSGGGKTIRCVDSPNVDAIVIANEHKGKDYIVFSTGNHPESPFAAGEFHVRTHGPINQYSLESNMRLWIQDGRNIELENKSTGQQTTLPNGDPLREPLKEADVAIDSPAKDRIYEFGDETYGCVRSWSDNNNISVSALSDDSVIHLHAPGGNSRVIVHTGGTVDIVADKKITLQSKEKVEINAPVVSMNGEQMAYINGGQVHLNLPYTEAGGHNTPDYEF